MWLSLASHPAGRLEFLSRAFDFVSPSLLLCNGRVVTAVVSLQLPLGSETPGCAVEGLAAVALDAAVVAIQEHLSHDPQLIESNQRENFTTPTHTFEFHHARAHPRAFQPTGSQQGRYSTTATHASRTSQLTCMNSEMTPR